MRAASIATLTAALAMAALLVNHWYVSVVIARILATGANLGVSLPGHLKFLIKLDHFAVNFGYLLIAFLWIVTFCIAASWLSLRDFFSRLKTVRPPEK